MRVLRKIMKYQKHSKYISFQSNYFISFHHKLFFSALRVRPFNSYRKKKLITFVFFSSFLSMKQAPKSKKYILVMK